MKRLLFSIVLLLMFAPAARAGFDRQYIGVNYSPYRGGSYGPAYKTNPKNWGDYTQQDIDNDLKLIAKTFSLIRTYTVQFNQKYIVSLAGKYKIQVALGAHLWQPLNDPLYNKGHNYDQAKAEMESKNTYPELDEVISEANAHPDVVKCLVVGNEWIGEKQDGWLVAADGIAYMKYVRDRLTGAAKNIPVTTCAQWGVLAGPAQAALVAAADQYVLANIYPFWDGAKIGNWKTQFEADLTALSNALAGTGKGLVIGETGWPSGVEAPTWPKLTDTPNVANEQRYLQEYSQYAAARKLTSFLFEMFDEPWKWTEGQNAADRDGVGDHWGIYDKDAKSKWPIDPPPHGPHGPSHNLLLLYKK
jgi:exo-beta-1,3-glucanase (GH17 family)